jgi:hypothetical protein
MQTQPNPLQIDPKAKACNVVEPEFDVTELEAYLEAGFGGRGTE